MSDKPFVWGPHARLNVEERNLSLEQIEQTLSDPEWIVPGHPPREVYMRRFSNEKGQYLIRVVIEEIIDARLVVTVYKTKQVQKYLRGLIQ